MSDTQEKLRRAMMTGPNRWAEATINGKLVSYYEIHDETILLDLIDSAKREGAIEELKRNAYYSQPRKTDPLELCGIDKTAEQVNDRIAQLEQSEKSE